MLPIFVLAGSMSLYLLMDNAYTSSPSKHYKVAKALIPHQQPGIPQVDELFQIISQVDADIEKELMPPPKIAPKTSLPNFNLVAISAENPAGRLDPFEPLLQDNGEPTNPNSSLEENQDPLELIRFTGIIEDPKDWKKTVAILYIPNDEGESETILKKAGDSFNMLNSRVRVRSIRKNRIYLSIDGIFRNKALDPFVDTASSENEDDELTSGGDLLEIEP